MRELFVPLCGQVVELDWLDLVEQRHKVVQVRHFSVVCEEGERALFGVAALGIFENVLYPGLRAGQSESPGAQTGTRSHGIARGSRQVDRSRAAKPG